MKTAVVSYSLTGNNGRLAQSVAEKMSAEHIVVTEPKERTTGMIVLDLLFGRTPRTEPGALGSYGLILFIGPVWCGKVASPLRGYLKLITNHSCRYAFCSISGGAEGPNRKLATELKRITDREPVALVDLHIADLLPQNPKPTMVITAAYRLNEDEIEKLAGTIVETVRGIL